MPKAIEDCVKKISGTNKRTGKPYTQSEKWAICTAQHKKSDAELNLDDIANLVSNATFNYASKLYSQKRVPSLVEGYELAQVALAKLNYDYEKLEMIIGR